MKKITSSLIFILSLISSMTVSASSGTETSGGGGAFVCRSSEGAILSSELLDLWEAKFLDDREIDYSEDEVEDQIRKMVTKLIPFEPVYADEILQASLDFMKNHHNLPNGVRIRPPTDTGHEYEKEGCPLEGMMYYDGKRKNLQIDPRVFSKLLTKTDIAASFVHEGVYKVFRDRFDQKDSKSTRKLVGALFDKNKSLESYDPINELPSSGPLYRCVVKDTEYYYYLLKLDTSNNSMTYGDWEARMIKYRGVLLKDNLTIKFRSWAYGKNIQNILEQRFNAFDSYDKKGFYFKSGLWSKLFDDQLSMKLLFINREELEVHDSEVLFYPEGYEHFAYFTSKQISEDHKDFRCYKVR